MRKKYSQDALKKSAEGTSSLFSFFGSKKRGRADEGKGLLGFLQDAAIVDAVKVEDLDEEEPLNWTPTVFSTSRVSAPDTSVEAHTSFVAELPRRPGHVAVRSGSIKGKGDLVMVVETTLYNEAVDLYQGPYGREAKGGIESDPHEGVLPDRNGAPSFQYATKDDAISAILETKQPYGDGLHKFLALSSFFRWQTPAKQRKMDAEMKATFTEDDLLQHSSLFIDETGNTLPKIGVRVAHDTGRGENVDYGARGFESDPKSLLTFDRGTIGGAHNGARKLLAIDSEEDVRLKTPEVAATTVEEKTMFVRLYDAAVLAARSETLFEKGPWLNKNVVGLAWVQGKGLSLVRTKEGTTRGEDPWVWLVTVINNFEHCWSGPGFVMFMTHNWCFAGYKNLKKHDRKGANQMEVGRSGDFSTPSAKGKASHFGMTANATVEGAWAREVAAEAAVEAAHAAEEQTAAQRNLVDAIKRRKLVVKARQDQATGARTRTVDGVKVTIPQAVLQGKEAPTTVQQRAIAQRHEDNSRAARNGLTAEEWENPPTEEKAEKKKKRIEDNSRAANSCNNTGCSCKGADDCTCVGHVHVKNASAGGLIGGTNGDPDLKAAGAETGPGNVAGSTVPYIARLEGFPDIPLYCSKCEDDWRSFEGVKRRNNGQIGIPQGIVDDQNRVVFLRQERHWGCGNCRCKPPEDATVTRNGVPYEVRSGADNQFRVTYGG